MNFELICGMYSIIGGLIFCLLMCFIADNENFYSQVAKERLALALIVVGVTVIAAFGYATIRMQCTNQFVVDQNEAITNIICCALATLVLGGLQWFLLSQTAFPVFSTNRLIKEKISGKTSSNIPTL